MPEFNKRDENLTGYEVEEGDCPLFPIILKPGNAPPIEIRLMFIEQTTSVGLAINVEGVNYLVNMELGAAFHFHEHLWSYIMMVQDRLIGRNDN